MVASVMAEAGLIAEVALMIRGAEEKVLGYRHAERTAASGQYVAKARRLLAVSLPG